MNQFASLDRNSILSFVPAAIISAATLLLSGCAVGHSMAGAGGACGECGCGECAMQHVGIDGQYASSHPAVGDDYRNAYPYPSTAQHAPIQLPPQGPQGQSVQHHQPPTPVPPETAAGMMQPHMVQRPPNVSTSDAKARTECAQLKQQTAALQEQLTQLQTRIAQDEKTRMELNQSLASVNGKVSDLSSELHYWKQEVQRIDADAEAQHRDDMATLESISEIISQLPQPSTASAEDRRPY